MEARDLYGRLEAARLELDSLRGLAKVQESQVEPNWLKSLGFSYSPASPDEAPA
jgi:hypothetical protein